MTKMASVCFVSYIHILILYNIPHSWSEGHCKFSECKTFNLKTKQGHILGLTQLLQQTEFTLFFGIPYAHPPTGTFRFKEPSDQNQWTSTNVWNGTFYREFCVGKDTISNKFSHADIHTSHETQIGEDCLYINLYIPRNLSRLNVDINTLKLPLIIYFSGWETDPYIYDAWRLVISKEAIIAQVNYRTGVFGFFSNLNSEAPGNLGLLDQSKAIQWLWDNIAGFGGDYKRITLMGSGLASAHIGLHAISSFSRVLYKRAICHGSVYLQPDFIDGNPIIKMQQLAKSLKCASSNHSLIVNCLRNISYATLHTASSRFLWKPIVDGIFLTHTPAKLMKSRRVNQVNYIIGLDKYAGYHLLESKNVDCFDLKDLFQIIDESINRHFVNNVKKIQYLLKGEYTPCSFNITSLLKVCSNFINDYNYYFPANTFAEYILENNAQNTYIYELESAPTHESGISSFERLTFGDEEVMSPSEKNMSDFIRRTFMIFSQYGDLSKLNGGPEWKSYSLLEHNHMVIGPIMKFQSSWWPTEKRRRIHLWNDYITKLENSNECFVSDDCMGLNLSLMNRSDYWNTTFIFISSLCLLLVIVSLILCRRLSQKYYPSMHGCNCSKKDRYAPCIEHIKFQPLPYNEDAF